MKTFLLLVAFSPAAHAASAKPADIQRIGAAAAVRGAVKAVAPNASVGRVIGSGKPLFLNDHVTTDAAGKLQVLLLDESVFTLGPNADMVLDEFVYDPNTGAGKVAAQITKGAFRFVTGKVARNKPENMNVKLKVGTIGVRGTVVAGETGPEGSTVINAGASSGNEPGELPSNIIVENGGGSVLLNVPGQGVRLLPGQTPPSPRDLTSELDRLSATLSVEPKKGDQAKNDPADKTSQESGASTGAGSRNALESGLSAEASDDTAELTATANQQGYGITKWSDLALLQGTAKYIGSGSYVCMNGSGPACGAGTNGTFNFNLGVNFDAKTIGGAGSTLSMSGPISGSGTFNQVSYANLSGDAKTNITIPGGGFTGGGNFNGTGVSFQNAPGQPASEVEIQLQYSDASSHQVKGSGTGTR